MNVQKLVSIGISIRSEDADMRQCLDRWLQQDYKNFELFLADDTAKGNAIALAAEYAARDRRIRCLTPEPVVDANRSRQQFLSVISGEFVVLTTTTSLPEPQFLSRCLDAIANDPEVVMVSAQVIDLRIAHPSAIPSLPDTRGMSWLNRFQVTLWSGIEQFPCGMARTMVLRQLESLECRDAEALLPVELSLLGAFACIPVPLLRRFPEHDSSSSPTSAGAIWERIAAYCQIFSKYVQDEEQAEIAVIAATNYLLSRFALHEGTLEVSLPAIERVQRERLGRTRTQLSEAAHTIFDLARASLVLPVLSRPRIVLDGSVFQEPDSESARIWKALLSEFADNEFAEHLAILDRGGSAPKFSGLTYRLIPRYDRTQPERDRQLLQQICDEESADIFLSTYYTTPISTPTIVTVYDTISEILGRDVRNPLVRDKRCCLEQATTCMTFSRATGYDLMKFFPSLRATQINILPSGVGSAFSPPGAAAIVQFQNKYGIARPYFLTVGARDSYKNVRLFLAAFAQLPGRQGFDLVCVDERDRSWANQPELLDYAEGSIVFDLQLSDEELCLCYAGAIALVYPSKYEGIGLPVLEALASGCPVITCPNGAIPEVAGKAPIYIRDDSTEDLVEALLQVQKPRVRQAMITTGLAQSGGFSWGSTAKAIADIAIAESLRPLGLREINIIVFPDWSQPMDEVFRDLKTAVSFVLGHPDSDRLTLLVDSSGLDPEIADGILADAVMDLLVREDWEFTSEPQISLLAPLGKQQWQVLLQGVRGRIPITHENTAIAAGVGAAHLEYCELGSFW